MDIKIASFKKKYKIKNKKLISSYNEGYIGKNTYEITYEDGTKKKIEQILKANRDGNAVVIIPITKNNNYILIAESRPNTKEEISISFPAGMVDPNEDFKETALRELLEETGYKTNNLIELEWHYQDNGCSKAIIKTFIAYNCKKVQKQKLDPGEKITTIEVSKEQLEELSTTYFKDANTKIAYLTHILERKKIMKFDAKKETKKIIKFIKDYYKKNKLGGVVLGISGGKDSGVVAGLFAKAIGPENVIGVTLPCHSKKIDATDAKLVADKYGFKLINLDLTTVYDTFEKEAKKIDDFTPSEDSEINLKPRLRMAAFYYLAQMYSKLNNKVYLVAGTGNKCEQFVGYFTKGGDGVCDINVLADLTVEEVIKVGEVLEVPKEVLYKEPSDGLSGKTDEEKLGFTYKDVAKVINGEEVDKEIKKTILRKHEINQHKFNIPIYKK